MKQGDTCRLERHEVCRRMLEELIANPKLAGLDLRITSRPGSVFYVPFNGRHNAYVGIDLEKLTIGDADDWPVWSVEIGDPEGLDKLADAMLELRRGT